MLIFQPFYVIKLKLVGYTAVILNEGLAFLKFADTVLILINTAHVMLGFLS